MKRRTDAKVGDIVQISLPDGTYAYGRVLQDAAVAFYKQRTSEPSTPSIGSRDYEFTVGVFADVVGSSRMPVVGHDPSQNSDDEWPRASFIEDPISGRYRVYDRGKMRPATADECRGLERAAVWDYEHIIDRLMGSTRYTQRSTRGH